jgi:hypothetical protein
MFNCWASTSSECNWLINTVRAKRSLLNVTYLTSKCPYCQILPIAYCASRRDANFELLSVVICFFTAEKWGKTFKLEIPILDPKMRGLGEITQPWEVIWWWNLQKTHPCVKPRRLSHYSSLYDVPFGLCMLLRNDKLNKKVKKAHEGCTSRIRRGATVQLVATKISTFRDLGDLLNRTKFRVDRFNRFGSTRGRIWGSPIGTVNDPYYIGMRYRAAMWWWPAFYHRTYDFGKPRPKPMEVFR